MSKAEELASLLASEIMRLVPEDTPDYMQKFSLAYLEKSLKNCIEQYGRLVQEAAAKEVSRYDVTIEADQTVTFKGSTYAQYIERMPLP